MVRPANIITSVADVIAGIAIASYTYGQSFTGLMLVPCMLLCFSTACLYGGGIVFNDVFDAETDALERPERAIPSGDISKGIAIRMGIILLVTGIGFAAASNPISGIVGVLIALAALAYDKYGKHHSFLGPLSMGICRGLNLLLGISILPAALVSWGILALVPVVFIFAITMISRGEVTGGTSYTLKIAAVLYALVIASILGISILLHTWIWAALLLAGFSVMVYKPLADAIREPVGKHIGLAVRGGILALVLMDAAWAAAFSAVLMPALICLLLPVSLWLAKRFAVT